MMPVQVQASCIVFDIVMECMLKSFLIMRYILCYIEHIVKLQKRVVSTGMFRSNGQQLPYSVISAKAGVTDALSPLLWIADQVCNDVTMLRHRFHPHL